MRKILLGCMICMLLSLPGAHSQGTGRYRMKTTVGALAGGDFNNMTGKDFVGNRLENSARPGYHFGVNVQLPLFSDIYLQPGLSFSTKGARENTPDEGRVRLSYLEFPLHAVYKNRFPEGFFYFGAGPYVAYAMKGLILTESGGNDQKTEIRFKNVVEPGDQVVAPYLRQLDAGAGAIIGYEWHSGPFLQLGIQFGIMKINPEYTMLPDDDRELRNAGAGLTLGFRL